MSTLYNTLIIALLSALIATVIGTLASIGIQSMNRKFRTFMLGVTNIPMLNADIVTGVSTVSYTHLDVYKRQHSDNCMVGSYRCRV